MDIVLAHSPEVALELRRAPPSRAWLAACRRCRGPEILLAFFEDAPTDCAALTSLLRRFEAEIRCKKLYLDRRAAPMRMPRRATHVVLERAPVVEVDQVVHSAIESAWFPAAVSVGDKALMHCQRLAHVYLPRVESIGAFAFYGTALHSINLDVREIGEAAFACAQLRAVSLPRLRVVSESAFAGCKSLSSVSLPVADTLRSRAFAGCSMLTELSLPTVRQVDFWAFDACTRLETVSFPNATVSPAAFQRCPLLNQPTLH